MLFETQYPAWLLPVFLVLAIVAAWILYKKNIRNRLFPPVIRLILAFIRITVIGTIGLLLISPWIRARSEKIRKPIIILAEDHSHSIVNNNDSVSVVARVQSLTKQITDQLQGSFQVDHWLFGDSVREGVSDDFSDSKTDFEALFNNLRLDYTDKPVQSLFLISDGNVNSGLDPVAAATDLPFTVNVIGIGDTLPHPDLEIREVLYNRWIHTPGKFKIRVYPFQKGWGSDTAELQVWLNNHLVQRLSLDQNPDSWRPWYDFTLKADRPGEYPVEVRIQSSAKERNLSNNTRFFTVRATGDEGEVLCLFASVNPDVGAIQQALQGVPGLSFHAVNIGDYQQDTLNPGLIILHGLPDIGHPMQEWFDKWAKENKPVWWIITPATDIKFVNKRQSAVYLTRKTDQAEEMQPVFNPRFSLFTLPGDFAGHMKAWPPLAGPVMSYRSASSSEVFSFQKILNVTLEDPLILLGRSNGVHHGFVFGEGIWRWRIYEYLEHEDHFYFDQWVRQVVQYLMIDEHRDRFLVHFPAVVSEGDNFRATAMLYNSNLEPVNEPDVSLVIRDDKGRSAKYQFGREANHYLLDLSGYEQGVYRYRAETVLGRETFSRKGLFRVRTIHAEDLNRIADIALLKRLAVSKEGRFVYGFNENEVKNMLHDIKPEASSKFVEYKWSELISRGWILWLLAGLLALEWFVRRWYGTK